MRVAQRRQRQFGDEIDPVRHLEKRFLKMSVARSGIDHHVIELLPQYAKQLVGPSSEH